MTQESIGLIGLGNVGGFYARNLLKAFGALTVYDHDPAKCAALHTEGAVIAASSADLAAQAGNLNVHRTLLRLPTRAPKILNQLRPADRSAAFFRENPHQLAFGRRQTHKPFALPHLAPLHIIAHRAKVQNFRPLILNLFRRRPAQNRIHTQKQFAWLKRFRQIIIRPGFKPLNTILSLATSGQQYDRRFHRLSQAARQAHPIFALHHHIHNDQVEFQP